MIPFFCDKINCLSKKSELFSILQLHSVRKFAEFLSEAFEITTPYMELFPVSEGYGVPVIARNVIEINDICPIYFTEMLFRKLTVNPRHCFTAADFFISKAYKAVFIIRFMVEYLVCS